MQQKNLPLWYRPIRDVMHGDSTIAKRVILGAVKSLPRETSIFMNDLKKYFPAFFKLRLVWNEVSPLTTRMLQFTVPQPVVKAFSQGLFHAGKKVQVLVHMWMEIRVKIQRAADRPSYSVDREAILTDSRVLSKYKTLFDRARGAIGYPSVEQHGALATSHAAAMDYLGDFLELGEPLSGVRPRDHLHFALQFIDNVETEAADTFRHFLDSQDPAALFPAVFLDVRGAAMLQLLDNKLQLEKRIDISDYAGELLSHAQPTPGVLHTPSHSLLQLSVHSSFRGHIDPLAGSCFSPWLYRVVIHEVLEKIIILRSSLYSIRVHTYYVDGQLSSNKQITQATGDLQAI